MEAVDILLFAIRKVPPSAVSFSVENSSNCSPVWNMQSHWVDPFIHRDSLNVHSCRNGPWCTYSQHCSLLVRVFFKDSLSSYLELFHLACPHKKAMKTCLASRTNKSDGMYVSCMIYCLFLDYFFVSSSICLVNTTLPLGVFYTLLRL